MFINYNEIKNNDITIDVRTHEEFNSMNLFKYNVPIINKKQHDFLKKYIILAIPIIIGFIQNRRDIKSNLIRFKNNRIILGCSQGRLRSPIMYLYAKLLGLNVKVLKYGIKPFFKKRKGRFDKLLSFLEI